VPYFRIHLSPSKKIKYSRNVEKLQDLYETTQFADPRFDLGGGAWTLSTGGLENHKYA